MEGNPAARRVWRGTDSFCSPHISEAVFELCQNSKRFVQFVVMGSYPIVRFIYLVLIFVVSIIFLIISPNIISILLGWDGLGLVSYLLVIYYQNVKSYGAGMLTVLSNRIGDVALLMVIAWIINFGSWSFIYYLEFLSGSFEMELISFLVVLAAITRSAQIPFSS
jgi:NADH-ubiquinone oxidoreductase chain 5